MRQRSAHHATFVIERIYDASPARVFAAWSEPEAKARWFQPLSMQERMELLCEYTDLIFAVNTHIADAKTAEQTGSHFRILTGPQT